MRPLAPKVSACDGVVIEKELKLEDGEASSMLLANELNNYATS